jgi:hypothetical protein
MALYVRLSPQYTKMVRGVQKERLSKTDWTSLMLRDVGKTLAALKMFISKVRRELVVEPGIPSHPHYPFV